MKFTLNAVDSNVISIYYLYLYNITSFCFDCSKLCSNCYCYSILPFKRCYIKRLTSKRELSIPRLCFIPALGSGSVFRAFGILESRPELRAAALAAGCCRPKAAREEQIQTAGPTKGSAAACNHTLQQYEFIHK